jgi:Protein of Unknown function (DUF2784)
MPANAILLLHVAVVLFNVMGLMAIWLGAWLGWPWIRNRTFRILHLALILFIVAEAVLGVTCPLTLWEDALRGATTERGFIERWIHSWFYWEAPSWVFTLAYSVFGALVALTWYRIPPARRSA